MSPEQRWNVWGFVLRRHRTAPAAIPSRVGSHDLSAQPGRRCQRRRRLSAQPRHHRRGRGGRRRHQLGPCPRPRQRPQRCFPDRRLRNDPLWIRPMWPDRAEPSPTIGCRPTATRLRATISMPASQRWGRGARRRSRLRLAPAGRRENAVRRAAKHRASTRRPTTRPTSPGGGFGLGFADGGTADRQRSELGARFDARNTLGGVPKAAWRRCAARSHRLGARLGQRSFACGGGSRRCPAPASSSTVRPRRKIPHSLSGGAEVYVTPLASRSAPSSMASSPARSSTYAGTGTVRYSW